MTTTDRSECRSNAQCRAAFGFASVCGGGGYCERAPRETRCNASYPTDLLTNPAQYPDAVVFGNLMDRSLATHRARENAARLAIKQVSDAGGLEQRQLGVILCTIEADPEFDARTRQEAAIHTAEHLIDTLGVVAIIGPAASDDVQAVFQRLGDRGVVFISPSATSPALSDLEPSSPSDATPGFLWRTAPPDSLQGAAIAWDMRLPGQGRSGAVDSASVIYRTGAYGDALANVFSTEFQRQGGTATLLPFDNGSAMTDKIAEAALSSSDEVLFVSGQVADVIAFLDATAGLSGFDGKGIFLTDAGANSDVLRDADPTRFSQVRGTRQAARDEVQDLVFAGFIAAYASEYGEDVRQFSFTTNAYDAAWLLAYGCAWSLYADGEVSGLGIARGLRQVSAGEVVELRPTTWNRVLQNFKSGTAVDVSGASGELDFDPATEETGADIESWRIDTGTIVGIEILAPPD